MSDDRPDEDRPAPFVVEWYRPRTLWRLLIGSALPASLVAAGAVILAVMGTADPRNYSEAFTIVGLCLTIVGPVLGIRHFFRILSEDRCLTFTNEALTYDRDGKHYRAAWEVIDQVVHEPETDVIVITREDDSPILIEDTFIGQTGELLAKRIVDIRRKALMGLLRRPVAPPERAD